MSLRVESPTHHREATCYGFRGLAAPDTLDGPVRMPHDCVDPIAATGVAWGDLHYRIRRGRES